ncbi:MAG: penicillin-binding transpeptidase domain-containing protein [Minisyncoccia bacterium]
MKRSKRYQDRELAPDEIFLDASNLPDFDHARLEGRFERPVSPTTFMGLFTAVLLLLVLLSGQAAYLSLIRGEAYAAQSEKNRIRPEILFAPRGAMVDRNGVPLVENTKGTEDFSVRTYASPGLGHLLGYVSYPKKDKQGVFYETVIEGVAGAERAFDARLRGKNGTHLIEEDALGNIESEGTVEAAIDGETLTLSVDLRVQRAFFSAIKDLADKIPYKGGAGLLMDIYTGEIIALVSYPEYDPNILSLGDEQEIIQGYAEDPREPYLDRGVSGLYTPGSIVKPVIAAGAFHDGVIDDSKEIVSTGQLVVPNPYDASNPSIFKDWKAHGATDMRRAIAVSSDVYFYTVGGGFGAQRGLGIERLNFWYDVFGFTTATGIELSGEESGFLPSPSWKEKTYGDPWRLGDTYHAAIGQYAIQITPLEALRMTAALANGGRLVRPTILHGGGGEGSSLAISQEALRIAREGMRQGVTEGTSIGLNPYTEVQAAGKTGTAQVGVHNEWYNSWAIGFFPYDAPRYAYTVVMERAPAGTATGGIYVMSQVFNELRQSAPEYFERGAN